MSGESKQIDEDENGPENGGLKSGPCLIAGFQPLTVVHPSYWNAYKTESGATFSIDMVRLKLSFINGKGEWLSTHALSVRQNVARWVEKDARAADRVIKREVKSVRKELGALAAEAQQMRKSGKQLESERASGRPESRSKGVDR